MEDKTQKLVALELKISQAQVSRLEAKALEYLRDLAIVTLTYPLYELFADLIPITALAIFH